MKHFKWLLIPLLLAVLLSGCSASDPLIDDLYTDASYIRIDSSRNGGYWHEYNYDAYSLDKGGSGAILLAPNASTLGGWWLDAINEYLYWGGHIEGDWDETTDVIIEIWFEVNVDNTGGNDTDTVKFQLELYHKILGELVTGVDSLDGTTVVGKSDQHELFKQSIVLTNVRPDENLAFRLNLNTILGDVTSVIVNYIELIYQSYYPAEEVY